MSCPADLTRTLWLDGALAPEEAAALEAHLGTCSRCADRARVERAIERALGPASDLPLPPDLVERSLAIPDRAAGARGPVARIGLAVAAAAAAVLLAALLLPRREAPAPPREPVETVRAPGMRARVLAALRLPRAEAEAALGELGDGALVALHRIAEGSDPAAARAALRRLAVLARRESLTVLLETARMPDRREEAVRALAALGDRRALEVLVPLLEEGVLDGAVLPALAAIGGPEAARALEARIAAAGESAGAGALVDALVRVDGREGTRALLDLRRRAGLSGAVTAALRAHREEILPHLLSLAAGRDPLAAGRALDALADLAPPGGVRALARLLGRRDRREGSARALARIATPAAAEALFAAALAPEVREAFRGARPGVEAWLLERLVTGNGAERGRAVDLLALCGGERAAAALAALAGDRALAPLVVRALGAIGGERAIATLARLARRPWLRFEAIRALGEAGGEGAVTALARLAREDRKARAPVLAALARIPAAEAVEAILRLDPGARPGRGALRALAHMDRDLVLETLAGLADGDLGGRARVALAALGAPRPHLAARTASLVATMN